MTLVLCIDFNLLVFFPFFNFTDVVSFFNFQVLSQPKLKALLLNYDIIDNVGERLSLSDSCASSHSNEPSIYVSCMLFSPKKNEH